MRRAWRAFGRAAFAKPVRAPWEKTMIVELDAEEVRALGMALDRAVKTFENELVHTEAPALQHALGRDYRQIVALRDRLLHETKTTEGGRR